MEKTHAVLTGTYDPVDTIFLLKHLQMDFTSLPDKEKLIQSGRAHYSEMIHFEPVPDPAYLKMFRELTARYAKRLAGELVGLGAALDREKEGQIVLVSLARAGTPTGALLGRTLRKRFNRDCVHYSLSIIRDRGIDENALRYMLLEARHAPDSRYSIWQWKIEAPG